MDATGAYTAERAAALSGVPMTTIHWWARNAILVPSVSASKVKLWSYSDLMSLRVIYWLRQRKTTERGAEIPRSSMAAVRRALKALAKMSVPVWQDAGPTLFVDGAGTIYLPPATTPESIDGQMGHADLLDLIAPFTTAEGTRGPDLLRPRPDLRIVPGRISGSPHVVDTRLETRALAALAADGFDRESIHRLYPYVTTDQIAQALELERQLADNLRGAA
jgi:uncharacterized protein (DUF433 family)